MAAVVTSAPGKVLMTGGYLILERPNAGIVLSTNARFFAIVKPIHDNTELPPESWAWTWSDVKLKSPQLSRESHYKLSKKDLTLHSDSPSNPFAELAIQYCVAAANEIFPSRERDRLNNLLLRGLDITVLGSNEFYSFRNQPLDSLPPFAPITFNEGDCRPEVAKTGLGSSAAMTTSVVAALLQYLGVTNLSIRTQEDEIETRNHGSDLELVHVISQAVHCFAQGKVGSGFDVSCAVFGSQRYVRFSPNLISCDEGGGEPLEKFVASLLNRDWDHVRTGFSLPPLMNLLLGEPGIGGSSTPSMVGAVQKWRRNDPQHSSNLWNSLSKANSSLEKHLSTLSKYAKDHLDVYNNVIHCCSVLKLQKASSAIVSNDDDFPWQRAIVEELLGARDAMGKIRHDMRLVGEAAGVPIEPESQTRLLDATLDMEGVLFAGVPGAGGFDAIFAVILGNFSDVASRWNTLDVLPLKVKEDPRGVSLEYCDPRTEGIASAISSIHIK